MSELMRRIQGASAHVQVSWSDDRAKLVERQMIVRKARRTRQKTAFALVATTVAAAAIVVLANRPRLDREAVCVVDPIRIAVPSLALADGSRAIVESKDIVLKATESTPDRVVMKLEQGRARFEVVPNPSRIFEVDAGPVSVRVLGTVFVVERTVLGAHVSVTKGRVRVSWAGDSAELGAGEFGDFPQARKLGEQNDTPNDGPSDSLHKARPQASSVAIVGPNWRDLARDGDYESAYGLWRTEGSSDNAGDLMLGADVARLSHHAGEAVSPLRRLIQSHRGDPRAPLAAFTLGRVLLDDLGRPSEAAAAFREARQMAPAGAMAQDALAREVESWSRAGDSGRARSAAELYLRSYPDGRRTNAVKKFGGIE